MVTPLKSTEASANAIQRVSVTHDAIIDVILTNPKFTQKELADHFGYSQPWISRIMCSDPFLIRLAERKSEIIDPRVQVTLNEKIEALAADSLDVIHDKLHATRNPELAFKALDLSVKALGLGARQANVMVQNSFVVAMPEKAADASAWVTAHKPDAGYSNGVTFGRVEDAKVVNGG
jgi:transcriptional regulator with XRE-family HTH domain